MSKRIREQFENETGEKADVYDYVVNPKYLKWLEQRLEAGQHETIVNCTVAELKEIAEKASFLREIEYAINKFHEEPDKFSVGDIRIVLEAFKHTKRN